MPGMQFSDSRTRKCSSPRSRGRPAYKCSHRFRIRSAHSVTGNGGRRNCSKLPRELRAALAHTWESSIPPRNSETAISSPFLLLSKGNMNNRQQFRPFYLPSLPPCLNPCCSSFVETTSACGGQVGALVELVFIFSSIGENCRHRGKKRRRIHCRDSTRTWIMRKLLCDRKGKKGLLNRRNKDYCFFFFLNRTILKKYGVHYDTMIRYRNLF